MINAQFGIRGYTTKIVNWKSTNEYISQFLQAKCSNLNMTHSGLTYTGRQKRKKMKACCMVSSFKANISLRLNFNKEWGFWKEEWQEERNSFSLVSLERIYDSLWSGTLWLGVSRKVYFRLLKKHLITESSLQKIITEYLEVLW